MSTDKVDVSKRAGWVWKNWIPEGSPTTVFGDGGKGKSLVLLSVMRSVVTGEPLPDGTLPLVTGNCLIISGEDSKEEITSRLNAMGGGSGQFGTIFVMEDEDAEDFLVPSKWEELGKAIKDNNIVFWAIDPIFQFVESKVKTINDASVRTNIFTPMKRIMSRTNSTGIVLSHMNKDQNGKTVTRASGSGAFVNAVRSTIAVVDTPGRDTFLMGVPKTNRAGVVNPIEYSLHTNRKHDVVSIAFEGERPEFSTKFNGREESTGQTSQLGKAIRIFNERLANGAEVDSKKLREEFTDIHHISIDTFNKAKKAVGAESKKVGAKWVTYFPSPIAVSPVVSSKPKTVAKRLPSVSRSTKPVVEVELPKKPVAKKPLKRGVPKKRVNIEAIRRRIAESIENGTYEVEAQNSKWSKPLSGFVGMNSVKLQQMYRAGEFTSEDFAHIQAYRKKARESRSEVMDHNLSVVAKARKATKAVRPSQRAAREHADKEVNPAAAKKVRGLKKLSR